MQARCIHGRMAIPLLAGSLVQQHRAKVRRAVHHTHIPLHMPHIVSLHALMYTRPALPWTRGSALEIVICTW